MADIARRGDLDVRVVNPTTQTGLAVTSNGDSPTDLVRVGGTALSLGQGLMAASIPIVVASDQTPVPVSVSGVDLDVAKKSFLLSYEGSVSTTEADTILFRNPGGSGKNLFIDSLILTAVTAGRTFWVRFYSAPTITSNGTTQTPLSVVKEGSPTATVINAYSAPTISVRGSRNGVITSGQFQLSIPLELKPIMVLAPGYDALFTILSSGNNSAFGMDFRWRELDI